MARTKSSSSRSRRRPPAGTVQVDFSHVKDGGRVRVPEGDYRVRVVSVKQETSQAGNAMLVWEFEGLDGKLKGKKIVDRTSLQPKALWKLRDLLEAAGITVPKKTVNLPLKKLIGKELAVTLIDDEYEGRISSKVADYIDPDAIDMDDDDEEDDEDEEDDGDEEDEYDEMDRSELKREAKKLGVKVLKSMSDDDLRDALREAEDEGDDDEDEDDLEDIDLSNL